MERMHYDLSTTRITIQLACAHDICMRACVCVCMYVCMYVWYNGCVLMVVCVYMCVCICVFPRLFITPLLSPILHHGRLLMESSQLAHQ